MAAMLEERLNSLSEYSKLVLLGEGVDLGLELNKIIKYDQEKLYDDYFHCPSSGQAFIINSETPLCIACRLGEPFLIEDLLKNGAEATKLNNEGLSPLWFLARGSALFFCKGIPSYLDTSPHIKRFAKCFEILLQSVPISFLNQSYSFPNYWDREADINRRFTVMDFFGFICNRDDYGSRSYRSYRTSKGNVFLEANSCNEIEIFNPRYPMMGIPFEVLKPLLKMMIRELLPNLNEKKEALNKIKKLVEPAKNEAARTFIKAETDAFSSVIDYMAEPGQFFSASPSEQDINTLVIYLRCWKEIFEAEEQPKRQILELQEKVKKLETKIQAFGSSTQKKDSSPSSADAHFSSQSASVHSASAEIMTPGFNLHQNAKAQSKDKDESLPDPSIKPNTD